MSLYTKEQINELKSKIDYFEFYQKFLPDLTQRGRLAWCICPWHRELKPSFSVDVNTGMFKCWGENIHGDIFSFYTKHFNTNFNNAIEQIAEMYNYELIISDEERAQRDYIKSLKDINKLIGEKYQLSLKGNIDAWNYLTDIRGFSPKIVEYFKLGCGINKLPNKESLKTLGLLKEKENKIYPTFFDNRVIIPRIDENGNIVSFTGRLYKDDFGPKYLHTTNTPIYEKSNFVFGLYQAKKYIKSSNSVVLVEGECFKPDAQVLTKKGWVRFDEYNGEDVMQVNDDLTGEFVSPLARIIKDYDGEILECDTKSCKIVATPNHNIVYRRHDKNKSLDKINFKNINSQIIIPNSIKYSGEGVNITDNMIRLLVAIQADGTIDNRKTTDNYIRISFKKDRKIQRFEELLILNNIKYIKTLHKNGHVFYGFHCKEAFKLFPTQWLNMSQKQMQVLISELVHWDGNAVPNRCQIEYSTKSYKNAEFIQTISHLCGYNSTIVHRHNKFGEWYKVSILFNKNSCTLKKEQIKSSYYTGKVYCVEVPSGKLLVRIKDKITVIGNCDMIKCYQKGILNTVSISGLNISDEQVNLLKKYTNNFYICLEDEAPLRQNEKKETSIDKIYNTIKRNIPYAKIYIIDLRLSDGSKQDPDMYLKNHNRDDFKELIKNAKIYNEFIINTKIQNINPKNIEEKTACLNMVAPLLANINNFMDRKQYIELVANKLMMSENDIYRKIKYINENQDKLNNKNLTWDSRPVYAQKILLSMCFCPNFNTLKVLGYIKMFALKYMEQFYKNIFNDYIYEYVKDNKDKLPIDYNSFFSELIYNKNINNVIKDIIMDIYFKVDTLEDFTEEDVEDLIKEQIETLQEYEISKINNLEDELNSIDI